MAGVSDMPFRQLCAAQGAGLLVNEMITSDTRLWHSNKSSTRLVFSSTNSSPRSIQIAGSEPEQMAQAARACVAQGAQIVDINMGCPAKKVCNKAAGSALLRDETLVKSIIQAVVAAVSVPVTLKIRTGWDEDNKNGVTIAQLAQDCGIQALAVHGRTRACRFNGQAEYDTIAQIASAVSIPVIANGDIDSPQKAKAVLDYTGAKAVMIGRAAQGNPWIFAQINAYLDRGELMPAPAKSLVAKTIVQHIKALHEFYGDYTGARIARKHVGWYLDKQTSKTAPDLKQVLQIERKQFNQITTLEEQINHIHTIFDRMHQLEDQAA